MEERHGQVAAAVRVEPVPPGQRGADDDHPTLRAPARLGRARGAGGENEVAQRDVLDGVDVGNAGGRRKSGVAVDQTDTRVVRGRDPDGWAEVLALDELQVGAVGHQKLTARETQFAGQGGTGVRGVGPDVDRT